MGEEYFEQPIANLRQGDIFADVRFFRVAGDNAAEVVPAKDLHFAMLLSQSCDIDKGNAPRLIVAPVFPLSKLPGGGHGNIKKNKVLSALFLPQYRDLLPESFVSFTEPMTVEKSALETLRRVASLSDLSRRALYHQYYRYVTRWDLAKVTCPSCGAEFDPAATLQIVNI